MGKRTFSYPFERGEKPPWNPSLAHLVELTVQRHLRNRKPPRASDVELSLIGGGTPRTLVANDMPLVFLSHNERRFLPAFFKHYRSMGVTRFICVDDQSIDGSREYLLDQSDADVFESNVRYRDAARGKAWREELFDRYGHDRWYINVDLDEFLVYESMERESVRGLSERLLASRVKRLPAPMIDLYPVSKLEQAVFEGTDDRMPWDVATHYDGRGYKVTVESKGLKIQGGVRSRMFGLEAELMKYPLIYWNQECSMGKSIHRPLPGIYNFAPLAGCLLHFKIFADLHERTEKAIEGGQYWGGAALYEKIKERLDGRPGVQFEDECSVHYVGPQGLFDRGFISRLLPGDAVASRSPILRYFSVARN